MSGWRFCSPTRIQQIFNRGGDYILTVKGIMPSLERRCSPPAPRTGLFPPHRVTFDRGHGRIEIRSIWATLCVAGLDFPGVYQAFRVHRQFYDLNWNPLSKPETVHGITSLTAWQANPPTCWPATAATGKWKTVSITCGTGRLTRTAPR